MIDPFDFEEITGGVVIEVLDDVLGVKVDLGFSDLDGLLSCFDFVEQVERFNEDWFECFVFKIRSTF